MPFIWSSVFGMEGCFIIDAGPNYVYLTETDKSERTATYPSLRDALAVKWNRLATKKLKVSQTYAKFRIFEAFRLKYADYTCIYLYP